MIAICFYLHRGSIRTQFVAVPNDSIPSELKTVENGELSERIVMDKFDPRNDWDGWIKGSDFLTLTYRCQLLDPYGLLYFEEGLFKHMQSMLGKSEKPMTKQRVMKLLDNWSLP